MESNKIKFVYLTSKRYTERDTKYQQIKVYSNCEGVELFVNGQSVGKGRKQQSGVFVWDDVKLDDMNTIKADAFKKKEMPFKQDCLEGIFCTGKQRY